MASLRAQLAEKQARTATAKSQAQEAQGRADEAKAKLESFVSQDPNAALRGKVEALQSAVAKTEAETRGIVERHEKSVRSAERAEDRGSQTGPRGGKFYISPTGAKVYTKSNPGVEVVGLDNPLAASYQLSGKGPWR